MPVFRLRPSGDIALPNGTVSFIQGVEFYKQKLACKLKFFLGEWFLDLREGVPYHRDILVKGPDLSVVRSDFRHVILDTPGIVSLPEFKMLYEPGLRRFSFEFRAISLAGPVIVPLGTEAFVLNL